jgi:hypothetical protein
LGLPLNRAPRAVAIAFAAVALTTTLAGCGGSDPSFPITDARELLTKTIDRAIALERVHLEAQLAEAGNLIGGPNSAQLKADLDLKGGEVSLTATSSEAAAAPVGLVIADGGAFVSSGGVWQAMPFDLAGATGIFPTLPDRSVFEGALRDIAADERVTLELRDPVESGSGRYYALVVTVPPQVWWDHLIPVVSAAEGGLVPTPESMPADMPPLNLLLYVVPGTLDIAHAEFVMTPSSGPVRLIVEASGHDQPMDIVAPSAVPMPTPVGP